MATHRTKKDSTIKEMLTKNSLKIMDTPKDADAEVCDGHTLGAAAMDQGTPDAHITRSFMENLFTAL